MPAERKREVLELVRRAPVAKRHSLVALSLPRSSFYRWQRRWRAAGEAGLADRRPAPGTVWNKLRTQEEAAIHAEALRQPDRSPRELAYWLMDHAGVTVSESTVYRVLKRHGLIREVTVVGFPAGPEYRVKTTRPNEQWQSDASYFFVVGWGWYYLISVLDDYSRFILAWDLKAEQTAEAISDVVQQAVEWTGMPAVPVEMRARLLTDRGSGYLAAAFEDYLRALQIRHIYSPERPRAAMADFIDFYNHARYHEGIGNVTPADVYDGRREVILRRRAQQKSRTRAQRVRYNRAAAMQRTRGDLPCELSVPQSLAESHRC